MSESAVKIYFVAGATRGIGLALVADIAAKDPSAIIYAGGRDPSGTGALKIKELAAKYPGHIEIVKYVAGDKDGNDAIAKEIGQKHGRVDTLIANAAIANYMGKIHETPIPQFEEHFAVNVIGPIVVFQSFRDLLKASPHPRFVPISSAAGSIDMIAQTPFETGPYGTRKAALNWVTRKIHFENEWLVAFPQCPGPVVTDMSNNAIATNPGVGDLFKDVWLPPNVAASILIDIITTSTREKDGGQFHNIEKGRHTW